MCLHIIVLPRILYTKKIGDYMNFDTISASKIDEYFNDNNVIIIDVRNHYDYSQGHIPTAINIPYNEFHEVKRSLPRNKTLILYCERGGTSIILARDLCKEGYIVKNIYGGINAYRGPLE